MRYQVSRHEDGGVLIHETTSDSRVLAPCWSARGLSYHLSRGAEQAAGARAALPTAEAKAEAWRLATADDDVANATHYQLCLRFWQFGQEEVLRPYVARYLEVARAISDGTDGWAERSSAIRQQVLGHLFPQPLADRPMLQLLDLWLEGAALSDSVLRQVSEHRDDAERALHCQAAAAQS